MSKSKRHSPARPNDLGAWLEEQVYPRLFERLAEAFPEFGFERRGDQFVATIWPATFPVAVEHPNPDRLVVYRDAPFWIKLHGRSGVRFLDYVNGGEKPRGDQFLAACRKLGELAGVPFPGQPMSKEEIECARQREARCDALESIVEIATTLLWSDEGREAREFLHTRGLSDENIRAFSLGLFTDKKAISAALHAGGHDHVAANMCDATSARWIGYIIIPWRDTGGRMLTLYGRWVGKDLPLECEHPGWRDRAEDTSARIPKTYALPGEGTKSTPFCFDLARRAGHSTLVLVEGVLDALVLHARGDTRVIACVGAQFSVDQVKTLARHGVRRVTICLDPDAGGDKGVLSCLRSLPGVGIEAFVAPRLPDGMDPDEFVIAKGIEAWHKHIDRAVSGARFLIDRRLKDLSATSPEPERRSALDDAIEILAALEGDHAELDRTELAKVVSKSLAIDLGVVKKQMRAAVQVARREHNSRSDANGGEGAPSEPASTEGPSPAELPSFNVDEELRKLVPKVWEQIVGRNEPPQLFRLAGRLVRVENSGGAHLHLLTEDDVHGIVFRVGRWCRFTKDGAKDARPPHDIARDLLANPDGRLPEIEGIVHAPTFAADGTLVANAGYDRGSRTFVVLDATLASLPAVPDAPSAQQVQTAVQFIEQEVLVDFPFERQSDRAHAWALLLLPFVRRTFRGPTPIHDIEAPTPGSGKGLLADIVSLVATGASLATATLPRDEDELRKRVTSILLGGRPIACIDNVKKVDLGTFAAATTADPWEDRRLGKNEQVVLGNKVIWILTGNNPEFTTEIARRCVRIRLDPRVEQPWIRTGFRHANLRDFVYENRAAIVAAILTIARAWFVAGKPDSGASLGSFEGWARVLGGILAHAGISGFLEDRNELYERADQEGAEWSSFVQVWKDRLPPEPQTSSALAVLCERHGLLQSIFDGMGLLLGDNVRARATRMGRALGAHEKRVFGEWRIVRVPDKKNGRDLWALAPRTQAGGAA